MTNKKTTKRALVMSLVSLFLCFTMLLGTTYAWFTDSVTSAGNKIMAGTLDIQLFMHTETGAVEITDESAPIFGPGSLAQNNAAETLWEPGKTQVVYFSIKNNGSLDLKYKVDLIVTAIEKNLHEALVYTITPDAQYGSINADNWDAAGVKQVVSGINAQTQEEGVALKSGHEHFFALSVHMIEEAGNQYQNGSITFDMVVLASQLASEADSFGNDYDVKAEFPDTGYGDGNINPLGYVEFALYDRDPEDHNAQKVANVLVPGGAIDDPEQPVTSTLVAASKVYDAVVVADDKGAQTYNVSVTNLKEGNTVPVKYDILIGKGRTGVEVYHYGTLIDSDYKSSTGYVSFELTEFSPITIVYDAEITENEDDNTGTNGDTTFPVAEVTELAETDERVVNFEWNIKPGSESQLLDAIFGFKATHNEETVMDNAYNGWLVDYYVMLETADENFDLLPEGSISLGGYYGTFNWVGFDNPEVSTNEFIPLLGSVGALAGGEPDEFNEYWTYENIVKEVGEFLCGVAIADGCDEAIEAALKNGARFIVELRITNPDDVKAYKDGELAKEDIEYYVTNRVIYNFADGVSTIYPENN